MRFVSLFAGIGGFDLALERLGHECVWANDIDKYCKIIYDKNFGRSFDVSEVRGRQEASTGINEEGKGLHTLSGKATIHKNRRTNEYTDGSIDQGQPRSSIGHEANVKGGQTPSVHGHSTDTDSDNAQRTIQNHGHQLDLRSITTVSTDEIPDHDLLVGGFPCQSFSIAGKRGGFEDTRGTLFFEIARILADKRPSYLLLENVKGLLSHDNGKTFQTIMWTLTELGYECQWQVVNSKNFGVPQNRERVFIVGHLAGKPRPKVFPVTRANPKALEYVGAIMSEKNKKWLEDGKQFSRNFPQGQRVYNAEGISSTLASQAGGLGAKTGLYFIDLSTQQAKLTDNARAIQARYHKGYSHRAAETSSVIGEGKIRRLTPLECERLQGFPDGWTEGVSDTQRYKMLGNAVTVNVVEWIAAHLPN